MNTRKQQLQDVTWVLNQRDIPKHLQRDLLWCEKRKGK